jgi:hypothetical protein
MKIWSMYGVLACLLGLLILASCGGGATGQDLNANGTANGGEQVSVSGGGWDSLPAIPLDTDERVISEAGSIPPPDGGGQQVILGREYLQMAFGTEDGDSLILASPEQPEGETDLTQLAYGLYQLPGGPGLRPLALNIECVPAGLADNYYVGVADYTDAKWAWFGPINLPEYELDLRAVSHQLATHLGNMYFIIVCPPGSGATHAKSTVSWGAPLPGDQPGFPHHLVASDGQFAEQVKLSWVAGANVGGYEVFRKPVLGHKPWERLGETAETNYTDSPLPDYKMYFYRVRALNSAGPSGFSNIDSGFAGGGDDPFVIRVQVDCAGQPVAGVCAGLAGLGEMLGNARTNENGIAWFKDLAPGRYIVALHHPDLEFTPEFQVVEFTADSAKVKEIHFNAAPTAVFHRVSGFVVTRQAEGDGGGVDPLPGITVEARLAGNPDTVYTTVTGESGLYVLTDLPEGVYLVRAVSDAWEFFPEVHEVVINGRNRPDRRDFLASAPGEDPASPPAE